MKNSFLLLLLLLYSYFSPAAQAQLLYRLDSKNGPHISYIYGTIHMMPEDKFSIPEPLRMAFSSCEMIAMEVDLNMDLATKIEMAKQTILPEGKTLQDITSPEQYQLIYQYCVDSNGMSKKKFKKYSRLKPFFLSSVMLQEDLKKTKSYELEFAEMAKKEAKKTMGLESVQVQLETINTVSLNDQVSLLIEGFSSEINYDHMLTNYLAENLDVLYSDIIKESNSFPNFVENFLNKRNRNWIPVIENQIEIENTFIAVGAGHLPGENGILALLRNKGYSLTPIPLK